MYLASFAASSGHLTGQANKAKENLFGISEKALLFLINGHTDSWHRPFPIFFPAFNMGMPSSSAATFQQTQVNSMKDESQRGRETDLKDRTAPFPVYSKDH